MVQFDFAASGFMPDVKGLASNEDPRRRSLSSDAATEHSKQNVSTFGQPRTDSAFGESPFPCQPSRRVSDGGPL